MKRLFKFRGRCAGAWRRGDHLTYANGECIKMWCGSFSPTYDVEPDTVGQFTGFYDVDGNEIYENDICEVIGSNGSKVRIYWDCANARFAYTHFEGAVTKFKFSVGKVRKCLRVIGNIFDKDELKEE